MRKKLPIDAKKPQFTHKNKYINTLITTIKKKKALKDRRKAQKNNYNI